MIRSLMFASMVCCCCLPALAQDLPAKMQGGFKTQSGRTGGTSLELIKMESADKARVKVNLTNTVNAHGFVCGFSAVETDAERKDGAWTLSFPSRYCQSNWTMTIKPVEGKQRFEGVFKIDFPMDGTVFFEW